MRAFINKILFWFGYVPVSELAAAAERYRRLTEKEITLEQLVAEQGGLSATVSHELCGLMADSFLKMLDEGNAPNYVEMSFKKRGEADVCILVTVQRAQGKTPHQLRMIAEEKLKRLQDTP